DVVDGQFEDGRFPSTAPRVYNRVAAGWGDGGVICPWYMYEAYQDTLIIRKMYPAMTKWVDHLAEKSEDNLSKMGSFGDWQNAEDETPIIVLATAYFERSSRLLADMASILGKEKDHDKYEQLADAVKLAFVSNFVYNDSIKGNTQTAYLMALAFDLLPGKKREWATEKLVQRIYDNDTCLSTGILGTPLLLPVLADNGQLELAYTLLTNTKYPSWGKHIENGATTIWERWDSFEPDKGMHEDSTNSLNHYAYGSVGEFMYKYIGGIQAIKPAFKQIRIYPRPGGNLKFANTTFDSPYGQIVSNWEIEDNIFTLEVSVPANTTALIHTPSTPISGLQPFMQTTEARDGSTIITVPAGKYSFQCKFH
ncbi:MAG: rhamnosidase, partial [Bacteroidetes bacterium]|nr:rhamnosidase [Bacteroidota bacterium]